MEVDTIRTNARRETYSPTMRPTTPINMSVTERRLSLLGAVTLAVIAARRRDLISLPLTLASLIMVYLSATGHNPLYEALDRNHAVHSPRQAASVPHQQGIHTVKSVTIDRPRAELYRYWRNLENLPHIMSHLRSVQVISDQNSRWVTSGPAGMQIEWDAEIVNDVENEVIGWRSLEGATVPNAGSVRFFDAPGDRGTEVRVTVEYSPPAGRVGRAFALLFRKNPGEQIADDLRRFKALMEAGEAPTNAGPHGPRSPFR